MSTVFRWIGTGLLAALATQGAAAQAPGSLSLHLRSSASGLSYSMPLTLSAEAAADPATGLNWASSEQRARLGQTDRAGRGSAVSADLSVLGDYWFSASGFRATGGLMVYRQPRPLGWQPAPGQALGMSTRLGAGTLPYMGLGYSAGMGRALAQPWAFYADVGVVMLKPRSSVRLGSTGSPSWLGGGPGSSQDIDAGRDWRVSPVIQMGVSYSF